MKEYFVSDLIGISIVTVSYGDIDGLTKTLRSIDSQTSLPVKNIVIASGYRSAEKKGLISNFSREWRSFIFDRDSSLYNAMNLGLEKCEGRFVLFLNGGDTFLDSDIMDLLNSSVEVGHCNLYRTSQAYGSIRFLRPKKSRLSLLKKFPGHQGFLAPLPEALDFCFDENKRISADLHWMLRIMSKCHAVTHENVITQFELGGVSNRPTVQTVKKRLKDDGLVVGVKEVVKLGLFLILGPSLSYLLLFGVKYDVKFMPKSK
jgi:glycosyltransferase involved in cell wall biosynthesis